MVFATCNVVHLDIADQQAKKINAMPTRTCGEQISSRVRGHAHKQT